MTTPRGHQRGNEGNEKGQEEAAASPKPLLAPEGEEDDDAEVEAAAAVYAYQRADGRRHDLDPIPLHERTWTTWSFLSLYVPSGRGVYVKWGFSMVTQPLDLLGGPVTHVPTGGSP